MGTDIDDEEHAYVAFVRQMLDDMASGIDHDAEHYARMFPACAKRIREELHTDAFAPGAHAGADAPSADTAARSAVTFHDTGAAAHGLPDHVGKYPVTGELSVGGMGRLLLARHPELAHKKLVIKTAKAGFVESNVHAIDRLRREATILGRLDHERICPVIDVLTENDQVFVVMPFIDGETLELRLEHASARLRGGAPASSAWSAIGGAAQTGVSKDGAPTTAAPSADVRQNVARDGRVGLRAILALTEEVAVAVHAAHDLGIVHRDLKPGNIMVRTDGHPVVLDFGLAVDLSDRQARRFTAHGDVLGTPSYMAPEQIQGDLAAIDRRTDVYALGAILYEMLTFKRAFKASGVHALYNRILNGRIEPPREANPTIPRDLEAVCLKAMDLDRKRRYATALDFAEDLRRVRSLEATIARPISKIEQLVRRIRRNPWAAAGVGTALILAVVAVTLRMSQWKAVGASTEAFAAFDRVRSAARDERPADPADDAVVRSYFPDDQSYQLFLAEPDSPDEMRKFLAEVDTRLRTGAVVAGAVTLVAPRCGVADLAPPLRFDVAGGAPPRVRLLGGDGEIPIDVAATSSGSFAATLRGGASLTPGMQYRWVVEVDDPAGQPAERWASFWVVNPEKRAQKLAALKPVGDPALEVLAKASVLASIGLAQETLDVLASMPPSATTDQKRTALLLRTRALDALGETAAAASGAAEYLGR